MPSKSLLLAAAFSVAALASPAPAASPPKPGPGAARPGALELLKKGIAFRTVIPGDQVAPYAEYLKSVLVAAGFKPDEVKIEPVAGSATLTARFAGADPEEEPIIIIDHMDVVEAKASDWTRDPVRPGGWRTAMSMAAAPWTTSSTSRSSSPCSPS